MSNTSCRSLDDLPIEILSRVNVIVGGGDPQVFRTASLHMTEGIGPNYLNADLFIRTCALHINIEAMFRQGMVMRALVWRIGPLRS
uniref:Uncharacterized protein n=1 Tax=Lactuca sativa TaxID=4236 RepID=A0A9R1WL28_LACSA|nr:hypothetical protein LSAT_V11C100003910 [Lactuca sativa]